MKIFADDFKAKLSGTPTLAYCLKIERKDSTLVYVTNHFEDLVFMGRTYRRLPGFLPSDFTLDSDGTVVTFSVSLGYNDWFTKIDLLGGLYDYASFELLIVDFTNLPTNLNSPYQAFIQRGRVGRVEIYRNKFTLEFIGLMGLLKQTHGELVSVTCRATFGDSRCKLNKGSWTGSGTVSDVTDQWLIFSSTSDLSVPKGGGQSDGFFSNGCITFISGENNGLSREVLLHTYSGGTHEFKLFLPMVFAIKSGDAFSVVAGCNKTSSVCKNKFSNLINMRAELFIPGADVMSQIPDY